MSLVSCTQLTISRRFSHRGREVFFFSFSFFFFSFLSFLLTLTPASSVWGHSDSFRRISAALVNRGEEVGWVEVFAPSPPTYWRLEVCALSAPHRCQTSARWPPTTLPLIDPALYINLLLCRSINTAGGSHKAEYRLHAVSLADLYLTQSSLSRYGEPQQGLFFLFSNCSPGHKS